MFFSAYKDACDVVSKGDSELKKVNSNLEKKKDKLAKQQKQQKDAMVIVASVIFLCLDACNWLFYPLSGVQI